MRKAKKKKKVEDCILLMNEKKNGRAGASCGPPFKEVGRVNFRMQCSGYFLTQHDYVPRTLTLNLEDQYTKVMEQLMIFTPDQ